MDHPNIVKLRQIFDCKNMFYMVMEVMTGGELFDRIVEKSKYSEVRDIRRAACHRELLLSTIKQRICTLHPANAHRLF